RTKRHVVDVIDGLLRLAVDKLHLCLHRHQHRRYFTCRGIEQYGSGLHRQHFALENGIRSAFILYDSIFRASDEFTDDRLRHLLFDATARRMVLERRDRDGLPVGWKARRNPRDVITAAAKENAEGREECQAQSPRENPPNSPRKLNWQTSQEAPPRCAPRSWQPNGD